MQEGRPLAYASWALRDPETRYATIERKWDIKHTPTSPFNSEANGKVGATFFSYEAPLANGGSAIIAKVQINTPYTLTRETFHS